MDAKNQSPTPGKSPLRLDEFLPYRLSFTSNLVSETIATTYRAEFGLSIAEWRLVAVIAEAQDGMSQREIGERTRMDKVTVSRAAKALVERQILVRRLREDDRRSHALMLTGDGAQLYARIAPTAKRIESAIFGTLDGADLQLLASLLRRIDAATLALHPVSAQEA